MLPTTKNNTKANTPLASIKFDDSAKQSLTLPGHKQDRVRINIKEIILMEGHRNYTLFYLKDGRKLMSTSTLRIYEEQLSLLGFYRIHKSKMINLKYMSFINFEATYVVLHNEQKVPIARRKRKDFQAFLKGHVSVTSV